MGTPLQCFGFAGVRWDLPAHLQHCREAILKWRDWRFHPDTLPSEPLDDLDALWEFGKGLLTYEAEPNGQDRWQGPTELICGPSATYRHGDCEDWALYWAGAAQHCLPLKQTDIFVTVYHDLVNVHNQSIHAVCILRFPEGNVVLDQRSQVGLLDDSYTDDIRPIFSLCLDGTATLHGEET